jgi:uncharacterized membrane protein (UPF0127 family)
MRTVPWQLIHVTTGQAVVTRLEIADTFCSRLVGLQFRRELVSNGGLLLVPCNSVHTCFLRFPIDAVFLDSQGSVLAIHTNLAPWRFVLGPRKTHATLELPPHTAKMNPGDILKLAGQVGNISAPPPSVRFLQG